MKKKILLFTALSLMSVVSFSSCKEETKVEYPIEISFTEYSFAEISCQWTNLNYDDTIIIINSNEKLASYINCLEGNYPEVDFSKHTLLLAHGMAPSSIVNVNCRKLQQYSEQNYKIEIGIVIGDATVISNWQLPIIVDKVGDDNIIKLISTIKYSAL